MATVVTFVGYVEHLPGAFRPEFVVTGDSRLPDGSQVSADTLLALGIKREPFSIPSYWEFTRERFSRAMAIRRALNRFGPEGLDRLGPQSRTDSGEKGDSNGEQ